MDTATERLIRQVVTGRGFEIRLEGWGGDVAVTITDPNDPRGGCSSLRGESGAGVGIEAAIADACFQALRDAYPQATACGRGVGRSDGTYGTCKLPRVHDGACHE